MKFIGHEDWPMAINNFYQRGDPFFFIISFDKKKAIILLEQECAKSSVNFNFNRINISDKSNRSLPLYDEPIRIEELSALAYHSDFDKIMDQIRFGNTYLLNLCYSTQIHTPYSLEEIYNFADAPYKLLFNDHFVVFSPERFVCIEAGNIHTYPMKGTIDARTKNAEDLLKTDKKELAEHYTIVDLLRNDLGQVSDKVEVEAFAFVQEFQTHQGPILQMSSRINGKINEELLDKPGSLLDTILPAGSVSGAPKEKTLEIISDIERFNRGFYTGIMGYFNGTFLDTAVMIRFIEKDKKGAYWYKSGGGITHLSEWKKEFYELNRKIYLPFL